MFTMKHNARRAARSKLGPEAREGKEFELYPQDGQWGWRGLGDDAQATPAVESNPVPVLTTASPIAAILAAAAASTTEPEMPTPFTPDIANGEIASTEYGLLLTRERAVAAAEAAGAASVVITQTARGMWCWRTTRLNEVWREANAPKAGANPKAVREVPLKASRPKAAPRAKADGKPGVNPKLTTAIELLKRDVGATTEEVSAATGWQAHSARARIMADIKGKLGHDVQSVTEPGRGKVYRIQAQPVAASA